MPTINAQLPVTNYVTNIYVSPTPVSGVGQAMSIVYFIDRMPMPANDDPISGTGGRREGYDGIKLTITKPDGTNETFTMGRTDPVGAGYYMYTPTEVGVYSVDS